MRKPTLYRMYPHVWVWFGLPGDKEFMFSTFEEARLAALSESIARCAR